MTSLPPCCAVWAREYALDVHDADMVCLIAKPDRSNAWLAVMVARRLKGSAK